MDKKNTTIGVLLMLAAFASLYFSARYRPSPPPPAPEIGSRSSGPSPIAPGQMPEAPTPTSPIDAAFAAVSEERGDAKITTLANDFIEVRLTDLGGAIRDVALKKYDESKERPGLPYVFNRLHSDPALAFVNAPGLDRATRYQLVSATSSEIVYRAVYDNRIEVTRRYSLPAPSDKTDPYQLRHETTFRNLTAQPTQAPVTAFNLGTAAPINAEDYGLYLSTGRNVNGEVEFTQRSDLEGGGFLSWVGLKSGAPLPSVDSGGPLLWTSVNNQFFTTIFTPDQPAAGLVTRRIKLLAESPDSSANAYGLTATARFDVPLLAANGEAKVTGDLYVGPKEYVRLANGDVFQKDQDKVMQFGFFKWFSQILLLLMTWIHGLVQGVAPTWGWGIAIILTTLTLKIVFLPLNLAASKSAKRMQKIQPEMQTVREKYKDNPQKMQAETMALFKKHRVNPMGGCLPVLITIPFFMGFFSMLQTTAELRFAEFLWASDLSAPDTIARIPLGFMTLPINIMPILMGATMIIQMRLVPQPTVDNVQAKMFKFMPWIFTLFCYNFSCALSLYSTINGAFTIGQQMIVNRMKDDPPPTSAGGAAATTAAALGKGMKNVTPKKKK